MVVAEAVVIEGENGTKANEWIVSAANFFLDRYLSLSSTLRSFDGWMGSSAIAG